MRTKKLATGNLKIIANNDDRQELREAYEQRGYPAAENYVIEALHEDVYFVTDYAQELGALTDSPLICEDFHLDDNCNPVFDGFIWWFPDYQVNDPYEQLKNKGYVIFTLSGKA